MPPTSTITRCSSRISVNMPRIRAIKTPPLSPPRERGGGILPLSPSRKRRGGTPPLFPSRERRGGVLPLSPSRKRGEGEFRIYTLQSMTRACVIAHARASLTSNGLISDFIFNVDRTTASSWFFDACPEPVSAFFILVAP